MVRVKKIQIVSSQVFCIVWSPLEVLEQENCVLNIFYALQDLHEKYSLI